LNRKGSPRESKAKMGGFPDVAQKSLLKQAALHDNCFLLLRAQDEAA
jgi:hypothetical protein